MSKNIKEIREGNYPLVPSNKKGGIFSRMWEDINIWCVARWLYLESTNPKRLNSESDPEIVSHGYHTKYIDLLRFQNEITQAKVATRLIVVLPLFLSKYFLRFFEMSLDISTCCMNDILQTQKGQASGRWLKRLHSLEYVEIIGEEKGKIGLSTYSSADNGSGYTLIEYSGLFSLLWKHWPFITIVVPIIFYLWGQVLGVWPAIVIFFSDAFSLTCSNIELCQKILS